MFVTLTWPYTGMNITDVAGISDAQKAVLKALSVVEGDKMKGWASSSYPFIFSLVSRRLYIQAHAIQTRALDLAVNDGPHLWPLFQ